MSERCLQRLLNKLAVVCKGYFCHRGIAGHWLHSPTTPLYGGKAPGSLTAQMTPFDPACTNAKPKIAPTAQHKFHTQYRTKYGTSERC